MTHVSAKQMKAARALLGWSQGDLAKQSSLSVATIRKLELGHISPRAMTASCIQKAVEDAGVSFLHSEGVQIKNENIIFFQPHEGMNFLFDDISRSCADNILILLPSDKEGEILFGDFFEELIRFAKTKQKTEIRLLVTKNNKSKNANISFKTKLVDPSQENIVFFITYGNRYVLLPSRLGGKTPLMIVQSQTLAESLQANFNYLWQK